MKTAATLLLLLLTLLGTVGTGALAASAACNGYTDLCQKQFNKVAYPTTHNSYAFGDKIAANQNKNIKSQLDAGIRAFMLDLHPKSSLKLKRQDATLFAASPAPSPAGSSSAAPSTGSGSSEPHLCHATCLLLDAGPLVDELKNFKTFMDANRNEVITIFIENDGLFTASQIAQQFKSAGLDKYAFQPESSSSSSSSSGNFTWPTLQSMINSNKRLVVFTDGGADTASVPWVLYDKDYVVQTPFEVPVNGNFGCNPISATRSLWVMNHFVYTNYTFGSFSVQKPDPSSAASVNSLSSIANQASTCTKAAVFPNFVAVDFYDEGDVFKAVASINDVTYRDTSTATFGGKNGDSSSSPSSPSSGAPSHRSVPLTLAGLATAALSAALSLL